MSTYGISCERRRRYGSQHTYMYVVWESRDTQRARGRCGGPARVVAAESILGLSTIPMAGDEFEVVDAMEEARIRAAKQAELLCITCLATETGEGREAGVLGCARARNVYNTVVSNCLLWVGLIVCQSKGNIAVAM
ncbi:unnamed protein product [Sphagnum troendelagicum]